MSDTTGSDLNHPILNLTPEEKRVFSQLFAQADTEKLGVVTGEVAVKFFERTKLAPAILGEIWQIADTENRGLLTSSGFCMVLRLIGHYQAGRDPTQELAFRPGPLPKFEGLTLPSIPVPPAAFPAPPASIQPQMSGGPIRVPPLPPAKAAEYAALFEQSGAQGGILPGETAKNIFEKARLPNEILGRIWNLADTEQRGALGVTEFIIAMHLLASYKSGALKALPTNLPAGLYEAASRRGPTIPPPPPGRPRAEEQLTGIPRQFSGARGQRTQSPMAAPQSFNTPPQSVQSTGGDWLISAQEKVQYDNLFNKVDTVGRGFITGEQAVQFFSDSGLPEDILAAIWDLADINSEGQLSRDEFAVAMYLIRQQRIPGKSLPTTLPANLVPPSMRNHNRPPGQATAPAFDNERHSSNLPKSNVDDLFGLDAFTASPPAQTQQSTGGSNSFNKPFEADPFGSGSKPTSPSSSQTFQPSPRNPTSTFKPFIPSSSFGQSLTTHSTGASGSSNLAQPRGQSHQPSAMDDLLGDNDPEVSKKLTQETTELANMSNQIGTLRTQMQEVQSKKTTTESDINSASTQKRDLELRLSQFRSQYEQEVKAVKALEDRLTTSRNETRKLQQEYAMIEGTYQDLQNQHRQVATALDADQRENANLKERIRQINAEVGQLRPQLEKMRTDARKEKGMVSINKKQLSTNEGERDKIKSEMNDLTKAAQEAYRSPQPTPQEQGSNVVSPAASTASHNTNPFFRKSPQPTTDNAMSPSGFTRTQSQPSKDFDNVFGPSFTSSPSTAAPPQTSFRQDSQSNVPTFSAPSGHSVRSSEGPDVPTPSTSPPLSSYQESPRGGEPPAPPESRQFASSFLPLREGVPRSDSFSSSVKVSAPASRYGGPTGNETPTIAGGSPSATPVQDKGLEKTDTAKTETTSFGQSLFQDRNFTASPAASATSEGARSGPKTEDRKDTYQNFGQPSVHRDIPGAFPGDTNSPIKPDQTGESTLSDRSKNSNQNFPAARSDPFATSREQPKGPVAAKDAFDAAFAGFGPSRQMHQEKQHTGSSINGSVDSQSANKFNQEFPPIEDIGGEEDSDSNSETGFADNFTSASPQQNRQSHGQSSTQSRPSTSTTGPDAAVSDFFAAAARPSVTQQDTNSVLPTPGAQKSPPTYDQTMAPARSGTRDSNQFPPEFGGLLPARQDPTSPPQPSQSPEKSFNTSSAGGQGGALFGGGSTSKATSAPATAFSSSPPPADTPVSTVPSDAYHSAVSNPSGEYKGPSPIAHPPQISKPTYSDDFDSGFDDLSEAKEADDKTDDDFMLGSHHRDGLDEFNPVFDSPAASKSNTMASQQTPTGKPGHSGENSFSDFEHMSQSFSQPQAPQQPQAKPSQDWDAIFSSLDAPPAEKATAGQGEQGKSAFDKFGADEPSGSANKQQMPQLGRALSAGTEHDDPILKKLTGMGYPREQALAALEKFDYDINMAADYLTSGQ